MNQIIKAFLGVFLALLLMMTSAGILSAFMLVVDAQDMHARMVEEVENSDFYRPVMEECFDLASEAGYRLEITFYYNNSPVTSCSSSSMLPEDTANISSARLDLTFPFCVSFFGIATEHTLSAYVK